MISLCDIFGAFMQVLKAWNTDFHGIIIFPKFSISTREFIEISRCFSMNRDLFLDCRDWYETGSGLQIEISVEPRSRSRFGIGNPSPTSSDLALHGPRAGFWRLVAINIQWQNIYRSVPIGI